MMGAILLVQTAQGATVGVRFDTTRAARDWEEIHGDVLNVVGCVTVVPRRYALALSDPNLSPEAVDAMIGES